MNKLKIATGSSVYRNRIKQQEVTVKQLFNKLSLPEIRTDKDGAYFIFASFSKDIRNASNVVRYYGATIDLDDTPLAISEVQELFKNYQYCIHTTHSHKAPGKGVRYRLVLPYRKPQSPERHVNTLLYIINMLGMDNVDLSSKALSRPMYLPACPKKREKHFKFVSNESGRLFNPERIKIDPSLQWEMEQNNSAAEVEPLDVNEEVTEGGRNESLARLVGKFIHNGSMDLPLIHQSAQVWNQTNCVPPLSEKDVKTITDSVYKAHKRNSKDSGWSYDELTRRVKESKDPKRDYDLLINLIAGSHDKVKQSEQERLIRLIRDKTEVPIKIVRSELSGKIAEKKGIKEEEEELDTQKSIKELKKEFKHWVYMRKDDKMYNTQNGLVYKVEGFNRMHSSMIEKGVMNSLLLKYKSIKQADMLQFNPSEERVYKRDHIVYANTYVPPELFPMPGSVRPMLKHFRYLIPNKVEREIMLDYIAYIIQKPGEKVRWMPIVKGVKGIGKSIIAELIIAPLIGGSNFKPVDSKAVKRDFNSWQLDAQIVCFHELKIGETRKEKQNLTDSLKSFIADPTIQAHRKGIDEYTVINKSNVIGFTNHEDAIMITSDERRFCMIRSEVLPKPIEYYNQFTTWLKDNLEEMLYYFTERDISNFNYSTAPDTDYTREVKESSLMWPSSILIDALGDAEHPFNKVGAMTWEGVVEFIRSESVGKDMMVADNLIKASSSQGYLLVNTLRELGFRKWHNEANNNDRVHVNGKLQRVWIAPEKVKEFTKRQPNIIGHMLKDEKKIYDFDD